MNKYFFFLSSVCLLALFSNCKKVNDPSSGVTNNPLPATTVEQDKQSITAGFDQIINCITNFKNGNLSQTMIDFYGLSDGDIINEDWVVKLIDSLGASLEKTLGSSVNDEEDLYDLTIADFAGTYEYDKSEVKFNYTSTSSDQIIVKSPSKPTSNSNDLVFTLSNYAYTRYNFDGENIPLPNKLNFKLEIAGNRIFEVSLNSISYEIKPDYTYPKLVDLTIYANPYTISLNAQKSGAVFDVDYKMISSTGCDFNIKGQLQLAHDDFDNLNDEDFLRATCKASYGSLGADANIDIASLVLIDEPTASQINQYSDFTLNINDIKIGDLKLVEDSNEDLFVHLIYKDGTSDDMDSKYIKNFLTSLESSMTNLTGSW